MKFDYRLYRPKKIIYDVLPNDTATYKAEKDQPSPLTKVGDAEEVYKSEVTGRAPTLAKKIRPNQLALKKILGRPTKISVRSRSRSRRIPVRVQLRPRKAHIKYTIGSRILRQLQLRRAVALYYAVPVVLVLVGGAFALGAQYGHVFTKATASRHSNTASSHKKGSQPKDPKQAKHSHTQSHATSEPPPQPKPKPTPSKSYTKPATPPASTANGSRSTEKPQPAPAPVAKNPVPAALSQEAPTPALPSTPTPQPTAPSDTSTGSTPSQPSSGTSTTTQPSTTSTPQQTTPTTNSDNTPPDPTTQSQTPPSQ